MKTEKSFAFHAPPAALDAGHQVIAGFGVACLVKKPDGNIELIGGTADDHADAREWCSLFAPETVFTSVTPRTHPVGSAA